MHRSLAAAGIESMTPPCGMGTTWRSGAEMAPAASSPAAVARQATRLGKSSRSAVCCAEWITASVNRFHHVLNDLLRVPEHHHGFIHVEQFVVQSRVAGGHGALVDNDGTCLIGFQDGHAGDG